MLEILCACSVFVCPYTCTNLCVCAQRLKVTRCLHLLLSVLSFEVVSHWTGTDQVVS